MWTAPTPQANGNGTSYTQPTQPPTAQNPAVMTEDGKGLETESGNLILEG